MYSAHIKIDLVPPPQNSRDKKHWRERNDISEEWRMRIWAMIRRGEIVKPPHPLQKAIITIWRHSSRTLDHDGMVGSYKPVVDALVKNGILIDDSWKVLGPWRTDQKYRPKKDGQLTEIWIEEN